ncbi:endolytic transglycosylase MltG [Pyruvatibacter sp.]|uniref:endolytic transglycosylase MltG n=1 Tax=Pyruvatibacter sp. TaxID=1981328 RepID=UPI0032EF37F7
MNEMPDSENGPTGTEPRVKGRKRRAAARGIAFFVVAFVVALAIVGTPMWLAWRGFTGPSEIPDRTTVLIEEGSGLNRIASQLESEGLVANALMFRAGVELHRKSSALKAGEYEIPRHASMRQIMRILVDGKPILHPITLWEGMTSWEIVEHLKLQPVLTGIVPFVPAEGTLLPETYLVTRGTSRQEVIDRMQRAQAKVIEELWPNRAEGLPFSTVEEALILASIVEKETGQGDERPKAASVFINRLNLGMRLQSDPTIIYGITMGQGALGRRIRRSELDGVTPYNTYQIDGLPPTPIANPGEASIAAVLNPADTEYLFFVADGTGGHAFARTNREHANNVRAWRQIQRERGLR